MTYCSKIIKGKARNWWRGKEEEINTPMHIHTIICIHFNSELLWSRGKKGNTFITYNTENAKFLGYNLFVLNSKRNILYETL